MSRITAMTGFLLVDANGDTVGYREHFEEALHDMNHDPAMHASEAIVRVSDSVEMATKHRLAGEHFWAPLWRQIERGVVA